MGSLYQAALLGNTAIPLSQVTERAQSPKDDGTQWTQCRLGPLHFAGNASRKKTTLVMALLILIPPRGGEDWKSSSTSSQLSWFPSDLGTSTHQKHDYRAENHPKNPATSFRPGEMKALKLWISLSYHACEHLKKEKAQN